MCPPLVILQTVSFVLLLLPLIPVVLGIAMMLVLVPLLLVFVGILTSLVWLLPWCDISIHGHCKMKWPLDLSIAALTQCQTFWQLLLINGPPWALSLLHGWISFVADGGCLFVLSSFVIVFSYMLISMDRECREDMQRTYMGILAMDLKSRSEKWALNSEGILKKAGNFAADFFSSSRLLISWGEDWPQGFIGLIFVYKYMNGLGFAGFSACVSFLKGVAIPLGQTIMCRERKHAVRIALESLFPMDELDTDRFAKQYARELFESPHMYAISEVTPKLREILDNASKDIMYGLNVREKYLFNDIWEMREEILEDGIRTIEEAVQQQLVEIYHHEKGISAKELRSQGYSAKMCRHAGVLKTVKECIQTGFVANDCARAGFSIKECLDEGLDVGTAANCKREEFPVSAVKEAGYELKDCLQAGYTIKDCKPAFSHSEFRAAGVSVADIRHGGFSVREIYLAGFTAEECRVGGLSPKDCYEAGFTVKACLQASFSRWDCLNDFYASSLGRGKSISGHLTIGECKEGGFTTKECFRSLGFKARDLKEVFSAKDCKEAGMSANDCRDAEWIQPAAGHPGKFQEMGYSAKDCKDAGFSAAEIGKAGFPAKGFKDAGFSCTEAKQNGFPARDLKEAGYPAKDLKEAGFSAAEIKKAGFSAKAFKEAGFSFAEAKQNGYSAKDLQDAGFSSAE